MSQHQNVYAPAPWAPRQANPDEDWTKISDLAERRRIQNRIAQRNYRKKLKRRLEDMERRACTSDGNSSGNGKPTSSNGSSANASNGGSSSSSGSKKQQQQQQQRQQQQQQQQHQQQTQAAAPLTPPELFPAHAYPPPEDMMMAPCGTSPPHAQALAYAEYLVSTTMPVTFPDMAHFDDNIVGDLDHSEVAPYTNYRYMPGMDVSNPAPYDHSNSHMNSSWHQSHFYLVLHPPPYLFLPHLQTSFASSQSPTPPPLGGFSNVQKTSRKLQQILGLEQHLPTNVN
ncbi:hypothetical protein RB601_003628 [Gaeumannomyces tritici]